MEEPYSVWNTDTAGDAAGTVYNEESPDGGAASEAPDPVDAKVAAQVAAQIEAMATAIESGDANNKVYKTLQRRMSSKDQTIDRLTDDLAAALTRMQQFEDAMSEISQGVEWVAGTTLDALSDEDRTKAVSNLNSLRVKGLEEKAARARQTPPAATRPQPSNDDLQAMVKARQETFLANRKKAAESFGVKPDDPGLDYGADHEDFETRLGKFEASLLKAAKGNSPGDSVRPKGSMAPTRSSGSGSAAGEPTDGLSAFERAAKQHLAKMK
jgi:hypothetical protein